MDTCVLLNLLASDRPLAEFSASTGATFSIVEQAASEVLWLDPIDGDGDRVQLDVHTILKDAGIEIVTLTHPELMRFIQLVEGLGDGEAATLAVAESRGWVVLTDDRKARRTAANLAPELTSITTASLVRTWSKERRPDEVRMAVRSIEVRASFYPPKDDPDRAWWSATANRDERD